LADFREFKCLAKINQEIAIFNSFISRYLHKLLSHKEAPIEPPTSRFYGSDSFCEEFDDHGDISAYHLKKMNQLSKIALRFQGNPKWEWPFLNESDLLLKYSMLMSFVVLMTIFIIQVLNRS
jgi:hypothetical protein